MEKNDIKKITTDISFMLEELTSFLPVALPLSFSFIALRRVKKMIYEEKLRDIDKKDLLNCLISNRFVIDNLSYEEVKQYYEYFKQIYKRRRYDSIKKHLLFWKKDKGEVSC